MARKKMMKPAKANIGIDLNLQGAHALLAATFEFLRRNNVSKKAVLDFARSFPSRNHRGRSLRIYKELERAQEDMGVIMGTWFSNPKFLDAVGRPLPLSVGKGSSSIAHLVRAAGAKVPTSIAVGFMRRSPSIKVNNEGKLVALRRVLVLPKLEVLRAAFIVERYLDTVIHIAASQRQPTPILMERSCHVSEVDLSKIVPLLRDLESRGTAFLDSIDGDLEVRRLRRSKKMSVGEVGIHVFVWTRPAH